MTVQSNGLLFDHELAAVLTMRHDLHQNPEISNGEWRTQGKIIEALQSFGLGPVHRFHGTGVYVDIDSGRPGPSIALRGDIDALPIRENRPDLDFRSVSDGVMHGCGHDIHTSVALGTAIAMHRMRDSFSGRLRVFFQPAEEAEPLGGRSVRQLALLAGFDHAVGLHVNPEIAEGRIGALAGPVTKSADQFRIVFHGRMAHGATPHKGVDAITIAAAFINEVQKIVSREMPADDGAIVTIGRIHGGEATNIICPEVVLAGTIRTRSRSRRSQLCDRVRQIAEAVAMMHRGTADCEIQSGEPAVINDAEMVATLRALVEETLGPEAFSSEKQEEGSDDFGFYSEEVPSIYFWLGTGSPGFDAYVHTPTFAVRDSVIGPGCELTIRYCLRLLGQEGPGSTR